MALWKLNASDLTQQIRSRQTTAVAAVQSVLERIAQVNPLNRALADVYVDSAIQCAEQADAQQQQGQPLGPLHGVPISIKINVDVADTATTDGAVPFKDNHVREDSPLVTSLRRAGAIIIGRNNAPAFSLRWFTDNELHGRTLNPFDPQVTPGGSSGGAAAATALGMGAIAHGNDWGGSVRYPAWACGVVGLRTTVGRVPSYKPSVPNRVISNQLMSVQGPLTRTVNDAKVAFEVMAQGSALDPQWTPVPLSFPNAEQPVRVAVFAAWKESPVDPSAQQAVEQAAAWLTQAGYVAEPVEPPNFAELAAMQFQLVMNDLDRAGKSFMFQHGDSALQRALDLYIQATPTLDRDQYLELLVRRFNIFREWAVFFEKYPLILMPNSWEKQFPIDDDQRSLERTKEILLAQAPMLAPAVLGLPGLSIPTGVVNGLPVGVQLVANRFREDQLFAAGRQIELAAKFSALDYLNGRSASVQ